MRTAMTQATHKNRKYIARKAGKLAAIFQHFAGACNASRPAARA
jgi:hypothetical protein